MAEPAQPGELGATLRKLRKAADLTGVEAGDLAGNRSQAWISRFENGRRVPSVDDVATLTRIYKAPAAVRRRLLQLTRDLRENTAPPSRVVMLRAAGEMQARIGRIEAQSARIGTFSPLVIPGLLQTRDYAAVVFASGGDLPAAQQDEALHARMARQDLLTQPGREFTMLMPEGALHWQVGGPDVMAAQREHLAEMAHLPNVRVGIIAASTPVTLAPMHAFDLYDERAAIVGTENATAFLTDPYDVAAYVRLFGDLGKVATFDEAAVALIRRGTARG